jgi:hypothetical protein
MRFIGTLTVALACAAGLTLHAQDTKIKTETKVKADNSKTVTYTGCVQTGTETRTYLLDKVVPITRVERTGTSGTTTTTSYILVPGSEKVQFTNLVGHKVEVTGMMIPAGEDVKTKTKTTIEREHAPDVKLEERSKTEGGKMPQFRVMTVKQLADSCTP